MKRAVFRVLIGDTQVARRVEQGIKGAQDPIGVKDVMQVINV